MTEPILLESFRIDFENGMKKAVKNVFPGVQVSGCFFHFKKAIWTNVQNLGLTSHFNQDVNFQLWLNMIYGFVKINSKYKEDDFSTQIAVAFSLDVCVL